MSSKPYWVSLPKPCGRMVLVEGQWHTGGGLHADEILAALPATLKDGSVQNLSDQLAFWGKRVNDHRYAVAGTNV